MLNLSLGFFPLDFLDFCPFWNFLRLILNSLCPQAKRSIFQENCDIEHRIWPKGFPTLEGGF